MTKTQAINLSTEVSAKLKEAHELALELYQYTPPAEVVYVRALHRTISQIAFALMHVDDLTFYLGFGEYDVAPAKIKETNQ